MNNNNNSSSGCRIIMFTTSTASFKIKQIKTCVDLLTAEVADVLRGCNE